MSRVVITARIVNNRRAFGKFNSSRDPRWNYYLYINIRAVYVVTAFEFVGSAVIEYDINGFGKGKIIANYFVLCSPYRNSCRNIAAILILNYLAQVDLDIPLRIKYYISANSGREIIGSGAGFVCIPAAEGAALLYGVSGLIEIIFLVISRLIEKILFVYSQTVFINIFYRKIIGGKGSCAFIKRY